MSSGRDKAEEMIVKKMRLVKQGGQAQEDLFEIIFHSLDELSERVKKLEHEKHRET